MKGISGIETENWYVWYESREKERKLERRIEECANVMVSGVEGRMNERTDVWRNHPGDVD